MGSSAASANRLHSDPGLRRRRSAASNFCREHADWLLKGRFGSHLLNYGLAPARDYVVDLVGKYAQELEMTCYRQDFNFDPEDKFRSGDEKDREGIAEIWHVMGLYDVLDRIRLQNPRLLVDNCASGGRRLDLEMLCRSVFCTRSDYQGGFNANPDVIQAQNVWISRLFPYSGCTIKRGDLYALRSAYSTSHAVGYWQTVFHREEDIDWVVVKKSCDAGIVIDLPERRSSVIYAYSSRRWSTWPGRFSTALRRRWRSGERRIPVMVRH